jgi:glucose-1-phosphate adenylyltransferase
MDLFSRGFVEILAAEQTPQSDAWFEGTADAVRKARRHFLEYEAQHYLILAGDHLHRMDYAELLAAHLERRADVSIAALPVGPDEATGMGILAFDRDGRIAGFEEKPDAARLQRLGSSLAPGSSFLAPDPERPFVASMGIYLFSRSVLLELLEREPGHDFGRELIPAALSRYRVSAFLHRGYWADVGTIPSFYEANIMLTRPGTPFSFYDPERPIYTHARFLPPSRLENCRLDNALVAEGCHLESADVTDSIVGIRTSVGAGTRIRQSVLLGADVYARGPGHAGSCGEVPMGIGRHVVLDRVIVDKNARIGDGARLIGGDERADMDGDGYCIRNGIVVVPKDATVRPGTVA